MKKSATIFITILILLIFSSYIYALSSDIDMNLTAPNNTNTSSTSNDNSTSVTDPTSTILPTTNPVSSSQVPSSNNKSDQGFFTPDNILNIILITIGIVLILLGGAIFIRAK